MMYKFTWKDLDEVVAVEEVGFFAAVRLLKGEGMEDADAALWLCDVDEEMSLKMECAYGYELTVERWKAEKPSTILLRWRFVLVKILTNTT